MSPWRSTGLVCTALLLACTKPNPAFDPNPSGSASEGAGPTSDPGTSTTDTPPTTSISTTSGATATDTATTTNPVVTTTSATTDDSSTGPACSLPGEPCGPAECCGCGTCSAGLCAPDDDKCGTCGACNDSGECSPQPPKTPCKPAEDPCVDKLYGLENGTCHAYAPAEGLCDGTDQCQAQECIKGPTVATCDVACMLDPAQCGNGMPVAELDLNLLCAQDGTTDLCKTSCVSDDKDMLLQNSCQAGLCVALNVIPCGKYKCEDADSCKSSCDNNGDCKVGFCTRGQLCQ